MTSSGADSLAEFQRLAEEKLKKDNKLSSIWYFINLATGERQTFNDSISAYKRFRFLPRILSSKRHQSTSTTILGQHVDIPIGISPTAGYQSLHPDGDATAGQAGDKAGTVVIFTSVGDTPYEDFIPKLPENGLYWAQTYLFRDRRNTLHVVRTAEKSGFKAIVVTVDSPIEHKAGGLNKDKIAGYHDIDFKTPGANIRYLDGKERDYSRRLTLKEMWSPGVLAHKESFSCPTWEDLKWLTRQTKLPIVLKGVLSAESARKAASFNIAGILVSAHGGRQLDGSPAPLDALPEIVDAVKGTNIEVYVDGGIRSGNDVVKALALGARAVFIGRPALHGLAVNGVTGIYEVLKILEKELKTCMALCGCSTLQEIDRSIIRHESEFHAKL